MQETLSRESRGSLQQFPAHLCLMRRSKMAIELIRYGEGFNASFVTSFNTKCANLGFGCEISGTDIYFYDTRNNNAQFAAIGYINGVWGLYGKNGAGNWVQIQEVYSTSADYSVSISLGITSKCCAVCPSASTTSITRAIIFGRTAHGFPCVCATVTNNQGLTSQNNPVFFMCNSGTGSPIALTFAPTTAGIYSAFCPPTQTGEGAGIIEGVFYSVFTDGSTATDIGTLGANRYLRCIGVWLLAD
jgi:hypothetical protein